MRSFTITILSLIFSVLSFSQLQAQYVEYSRELVNQLGGPSWDRVSDLVTTKDNKTFIIGSFISSLSVNTHQIQSAGSEDIFLAGYDEAGYLISMERFGGRRSDEGYGLSSLTNNDLILCGNIMDTVTFGNIISKGIGARSFITKRKGMNDYAWVTTFSSTESLTLVFVGSDDEDNIYVAGSFRGTLSYQDFSAISQGGTDIFIAKLNTEGSILQIVPMGSMGNDVINTLSVSPTGKVFISGLPGANFSVGQINITADINSGNSSDPFILCFDKDLNALWKNQIDGEEYCIFSDITFDVDENVYVTGTHNMKVNIAGSIYNSQGYSDAFLIKYNSDRSFDWACSFGSWYYDYGYNAFTGPDGTTYITGSLGDDIEVDDIQLTSSESGRNSAYVLAFSSEGKAVWGRCITGSGSIEGSHVIRDQKGNIIFTGSFNYGNIETETQTLNSYGDQDVFLTFYFYDCINLRDEITGDNFLCPGSTSELSVSQVNNDINWNNGISDQDAITIDATGLYSVSMVDPYGCNQTDSILIKVPDFYLGNDTVIPVNQSLQLKAPENFLNFIWKGGSTGTTLIASATNNNPGLYDFWLSAEYSKGGCLANDTISIQFIEVTGTDAYDYYPFQIYPVPADQFLNIMFETEGPGTNLLVNLVDLEGKVILTRQIHDYLAGSTFRIDVGTVETGVYILQLQIGTQIINRLFMIRH